MARIGFAEITSGLPVNRNPRPASPGKLVAYLVAVDRPQKGFLIEENKNRTAA
jgi:hypothetical protein